MDLLSEFYNKFNEDKRLESRHGKLEFLVTMKYINECIESVRDGRANEEIKILDLGAATGRYTIPLASEGYRLTAVEYVQHNVGRLKQKAERLGLGENVTAYRGNALKLKKIRDEEFDLVLLFGPMYHLFSDEDRVKALSEATRVLKKGGMLMVAYIMNEYAILVHGFMEQTVIDSIKDGKLTEDFKVRTSEEDIFSYVSLEDIDRYVIEVNKEKADGTEVRTDSEVRTDFEGMLRRVKIFSPDGPANHMRMYINRLTEEEYELFIKYQMSVCERADLLGAGGHTVDVLRRSGDV